MNNGTPTLPVQNGHKPRYQCRIVGYFYVWYFELPRTEACHVYLLKRTGAMRDYSVVNNDCPNKKYIGIEASFCRDVQILHLAGICISGKHLYIHQKSNIFKG